MSTVISEIRSTNWQISTAGFGVIAEGVDDIRQCLDILLRTPKGSDPLRPEFGSDIFQYADAPVNVAIPNVKRAIIEAVEIWEKRVTIQTVADFIDNSNIFFNVTYGLVDQDTVDSLSVNLDMSPVADVVTGSLILQAYYPPNPNGRNYYLNLVFDNKPAQPESPSNGFATLMELFTWAKDNIAYAGRWVQLTDRIILYVNPGVATTASISIDLLSSNIILRAFLPFLGTGQTYGVQLNFPPVNGVGSDDLSNGSDNKGDLLYSLQNNFSKYGKWSIESGNVDVLGDFVVSDFSTRDFASSLQSGYYLILNSSTLPEGNLIVTANANG